MTLSDSIRQNMIGVSASMLKIDGADCHVANDPSLTKYERGDEPDAEWLTFVGNVVVALDENDISTPGLFEPDRVDDKQSIFTRIRILQHNAGVVWSAGESQQHHAGAVLKRDDRRQCFFQLTELLFGELATLAFRPADRAHWRSCGK